VKKKTLDMMRWYKKRHKPISVKKLGKIADFIKEVGDTPATEPMNLLKAIELWEKALHLLLEVRRLRKVKK
jgi:hypothetical protein